MRARSDELALVYCGEARNPIAPCFRALRWDSLNRQIAVQLEVLEALVIISLAILQEHNLLESDQRRRPAAPGRAGPSMHPSLPWLPCLNNIAWGANGNFVRSC
jgi:hypothetical protein